MSRFVLFVVGFGCLLTSTILAQQLPPGYQGVIQITNDNAFNRRPSMNNHGQFVFAMARSAAASASRSAIATDQGPSPAA